MDFSKTQADPRRRFIGIAFVVVLHAVLLFGLMSGLARKEVDVARAPIETKVIEEVTKPPPPPELPPPPPPKLEAPPPPPFIPPPEVQVAVPPPPAPAITATPTPPPPAPVPIAPTVPVPAPAPPAAPPAPPSVAVSCPGYKELMMDAGFPREATRAQLNAGEVTVSFTIGTRGEVKNVAIVKSTHRAFNRHSLEMVAQFKCIGQAQESTPTVVLSYKAPE
ncbi:energy transducer TonB [Piscinibacter sp. HJYY11]|uniref:energy transducer TonB n=1 Tax=Piscinibacter sp. HJYY11 TaxID=2801333 RepID=UPI00191F947E|nr:TonB family protein [Piscinibacter sp. HJYY11]MBL0726298.1 TonB family protein [Piscinibacter sp. HJYY11]